MPKANRLCNYCGKPYYVCYRCVSINSIYNTCHSRECYNKMLETQNEKFYPIIVEKGHSEMKGILKNKEEIEIIGYSIELGRFDSAEKTYVAADFDKFILTYEELQEIAKM